MGLFTNKNSGGMSDGDKLFKTAKDGIVVLEKGYKDLSDKGKFEVIMFNSVIALRVYDKNHTEKYEKAERDFFKALFLQADTYQINSHVEYLTNFINARFRFYSQEVQIIYTERGYIPERLFNTFYISPLAKEPKQSSDIPEIMLFIFGLRPMMRWVSDNAEKL